jgi:tRNA A-37 threonylcarbamoyl transferase component Bud32
VSDVAELESALRELPKVGTLVKDRPYRQVWRFEHGGRGYFVKFYPREAQRLKRLVRGNPALREFARLQWLQKAGVPAPHARAVLVGFRVSGRLGDAVLIDAIEPGVQLDAYLSEQELNGNVVANHRALADKVIALVRKLGEAGLGHSDLHLGNLLLRPDGEIFLLDGYAVRRGGLRTKDVMRLGHSARRFATTADLLRGWYELAGAGAMPKKNRVSPRLFRKFLQRTRRGNNSYFGELNAANRWRGRFIKQIKFPRRWSRASQLKLTREDWEQAWPDLLARIESEQFTVLKRSASGEVLEGELVLRGKPIPVIIKRPRRKYWYRRLNSIGRASRVWRTWLKAWKLFIRNVPCEWPLLVMERRVLGYVTDQLLVLEKMQGTSLSSLNLDALEAEERQTLFRRLGRTLRRLEVLGFTHFDSKSSNWIIRDDDFLGPLPILIDMDGVRHYRWIGFGIDRLLRSMREHTQYTPPDSLELCLGYVPRGRLLREQTTADEPAETETTNEDSHQHTNDRDRASIP